MSTDWKKSKTFCVYPWMHLYVKPTGRYGFCCVGKDGGAIWEGAKMLSVHETPIDRPWNSSFMKRLRENMVKGVQSPECEHCYFQEGIGKRSYRQIHNQEWLDNEGDEITQRVESSIKNEFKVDRPPVYLDLRLGNVCNLKCRMCGPGNSSKIQTETLKLIKNNGEYRELWDLEYAYSVPQSFPSWYQSEGFWEDMKKNIPHLKKLYLTGGEPTLVKQNYEFLRACVEADCAKNIFLMINTNATILREDFLDLLQQFKFTLINVSIDGVGKVNDYIRSGSDWSVIEKNIRNILTRKGPFQVGFTPSIQATNILNLAPLLQLAEDLSVEFEKEIDVDFLYVTDPAFLNPTILPHSIRKMAMDRLIEFRDHSKYYGNLPFLTNSIDSCLNHLSVKSGPNRQKLSSFLKQTKILDQERGEDIYQALPELMHELKLAEVIDG